jgi:predicted RNA-binding Zn-ribbon protein involved in translation (DUF1610 family)
MVTVKCPKCKEDVVIDIAKCVDEEGEVHVCPKCGMFFRWVEK